MLIQVIIYTEQELIFINKKINFAVIGCGLMGREFASAASRWCHLLDNEIAQPVIYGICDVSDDSKHWFRRNFDTIKYDVTDYRELLSCDDIDAVYCAVPHNLHERLYIDIINAGKHLLGEKPFGIDIAANKAILDAVTSNPKVTVRCSSEFPYFPGCRELISRVRAGECGDIIEVRSAFCHSSDMDRTKPINWKRIVEINGEYGCLGDLGIHTEHVPFRLGMIPDNVIAKLTKRITSRPDKKGGIAECRTWDNAMLICDTADGNGGTFPVYYETKRLSPGSTNEWKIEVYGLDASFKFSTNDPNGFYFTQNCGKTQAWCRLGIGFKPMFPTITGEIFEFGFSDSILQMWAAFISEIEGREVEFGCFTPEETRLSHILQTAALNSHDTGCIQKIIL